MQKRGKTASGTQRWYCVQCDISTVRTRPDRRIAQHRKAFMRWACGIRSLDDIASGLHVSRQTLTTRFHTFLDIRPHARECTTHDDVLILDAIWLGGRSCVALIARSLVWVRLWGFAERETEHTWAAFCERLPIPRAVVIDGHHGLFKAVLSRFKGALVQRCLAHVMRSCLSKLTKHPRTLAGRELRVLVCALTHVRTRRARRRWVRAFRRWERTHKKFLLEKTYYTSKGRTRWHYTHRSVRAARSHLTNALPFLFTYVRHPWIPRTSNHIEGGTNALIAERLKRHRGMPLRHRKSLVAYFLSSKAEKKPPRFFT